jgi:hypothetical protein
MVNSDWGHEVEESFRVAPRSYAHHPTSDGAAQLTGGATDGRRAAGDVRHETLRVSL